MATTNPLKRKLNMEAPPAASMCPCLIADPSVLEEARRHGLDIRLQELLSHPRAQALRGVLPIDTPARLLDKLRRCDPETDFSVQRFLKDISTDCWPCQWEELLCISFWPAVTHAIAVPELHVDSANYKIVHVYYNYHTYIITYIHNYKIHYSVWQVV